MNVTQLSIFLENKPGRLQNVLKVLAEKDVNILTLTIAEVNDFGIVRMIVNRAEEAAAALKAEHITCSTTEVLAVAIDDAPGSLLKAIDTFTRNNLNIEYMYAFTEKHDVKPVMIFRFDDMQSAAAALQKEGLHIITKEEILGR